MMKYMLVAVPPSLTLFDVKSSRQAFYGVFEEQNKRSHLQRKGISLVKLICRKSPCVEGREFFDLDSCGLTWFVTLVMEGGRSMLCGTWP